MGQNLFVTESKTGFLLLCWTLNNSTKLCQWVNAFACCTLYRHLLFKNLKHPNHSWGLQPCMQALWNEIQQFDKAGLRYSSDEWATDFFIHRVLGLSKPQNGLRYFMVTSTLSMQWSGLTFSLYSGVYAAYSFCQLFSPTEDPDILFSTKNSDRALHSDPDL